MKQQVMRVCISDVSDDLQYCCLNIYLFESFCRVVGFCLLSIPLLCTWACLFYTMALCRSSREAHPKSSQRSVAVPK